MRRLAAASLLALALSTFAALPVHPQTGRVVAPPENLVVEGIPPIPASLADEVRKYTEFRSAALLTWHPLRRELLIGTRFANTVQVHGVRAPGGARTQLTFFDEPVSSARYEPKNGKYFVFLRDTGGDEFWQLYRYDLADRKVTLLSDGGRSQNGLGVWNNAGDRLVYPSTRRTGADRDLYLIDPSDPGTNRLLLEVQGGGWGVLDWSPDDRQLIVGERLSVNQSHLYTVDVATGRKAELTPRGAEPVAYGDAAFSADGRSVYLTSDQGSEFLRLFRLDLATKRISPITAGIQWDVVAMALSRDRKQLAFLTNEAGVSRLYLLDTSTNRYRPVPGLPAGVFSGLQWHANGRELGLTVASAQTVADVYSINVASGQVTRWTESELGGINTAEISPPRLIRWTSFDGREISGFYYPPPARFTGRRPVIVNIHGGPEGQSRPTFIGRNNYFLNELGVGMIFPNVRGSTGYGKTFVALDNALKRLDSVKDIGALLDWIARQPDLDSSRVMVTGGSYGGYMTLAVAADYANRICCSIDIVGISNFNTFLRNTEAYRRDLRRPEYGDERVPEVAAFFERTAPLNNAQKITKPLFVVQGGNDPRVPRTESEQMVARVRANGAPVWYLMARDEGHGFQKKANADFQFYSTVMFVRTHLLREKFLP
ncbi:MAG: S9 family peptidase [Gemmatimonadetes bacterium]|nr:S9 family peptidase [Gemmatimonadota bacterium]